MITEPMDRSKLLTENVNIEHPQRTNDAPDLTTIARGDHAALYEVFLFFGCGMGGSLSYIATLSSLVYFAEEYGPDSYIYLNLGVYFPLVPIALAQARWDQSYDRQLGSYRTFFFRGVMGFVISIAGTALIPFARNLPALLTLTTFLGTAGAVLQGTLNQMASFVSFDNRLKVAVSAGLQSSALVTLIASAAVGFGSSGSESGFAAFFVIISFIESFLFGLFLLLMSCSRPVEVSMMRRDSSIASISPLLEVDAESESASTQRSELLEWSYRRLWKLTSLPCTTLVITLIPSFMVGSWFTQVKSDWVTLPQILFYTRIGSDFLGRLATIPFPPGSVRCLFISSVVRLLPVVLFFVDASTTLIPESDQLSVLLVSLIAFSSGYLVTGCFQLAPRLLPPDQQETNVAKQASLLNVAFSFAAVGGLLSSFLLLATGL